jgi:polyhydroxybutyrate depolymerase
MRSILIVLLLIISFCFLGQVNSSIQHDGLTRDFVYYTPSNWNSNQQLPLLVVLHGLTQTGNGIMNITDFNTIAEDNNFIVCYPDGINNSFNANMNLTVSTADDLGFIESLIAYFEQNLNSDPLKRYLCGFSTGGFMCHKLACESSLCFAALGTVSGNMSDTVYMNCSPNNLTSVLHIHGAADPVVSYNGSPNSGVSVDSTMEKWRNYLGCDITPIMTAMPNNNIFDLSYPERYTYSSCGNYSLELIKIIGGGHQWPGIATLVGGLGNINMDFYSPQVIWEFLENKSCPNPISIIKNKKYDLQIFPNPTNDLITLEIENHNGSFNVEIYDLQGRLLETTKSKTVSLKKYSKGIYIFRVSYGNKTEEERVLRQ